MKPHTLTSIVSYVSIKGMFHKTFHGLSLFFFKTIQGLFQFSEIQGLFRAGLEFKACPETLFSKGILAIN